jgi:hypothetical protein
MVANESPQLWVGTLFSNNKPPSTVAELDNHIFKTMNIVVEGCAHGELDIIYNTLQHIESSQKIAIDLLICCGDFQVLANIIQSIHTHSLLLTLYKNI